MSPIVVLEGRSYGLELPECLNYGASVHTRVAVDPCYRRKNSNKTDSLEFLALECPTSERCLVISRSVRLLIETGHYNRDKQTPSSVVRSYRLEFASGTGYSRQTFAGRYGAFGLLMEVATEHRRAISPVCRRSAAFPKIIPR